jgi:hypothetical protein
MPMSLFSAVAGAGLFLSLLPAEAASNLNSSKSNTYRAVSTDADRAACTQAGGRLIMQNGVQVCETAQTGGGIPEPQEGITITGCTPSASGDPMKGLNVSKGGTNTGGVLCP